MSEYVDFHYMPLEGKITGEQVLKQTEDAINDLGNKVYSLDIDQLEIDEAIEKSNEAINTANSALSAVTTGRSVWLNNVSEMVATDIEAGVTAETKGYYVANDGGNALYLIRQEKSGDVVDGGSLIALDNGNMAELVTDGTVNVKQFGAIGNGTDDDTTVFQNTSSYAQANGFVPFVGVATYKITGNVTGTFNSFGEVTITGGGTVDIINLHEVVSDVSDIRDEVVDATANARTYAENAQTSATNASNSASSASTTATQLIDYLATKETLTAPAVDPTLTISGAAADAKATGDVRDNVFALNDGLLAFKIIENEYINQSTGEITPTTDAWDRTDYIEIPDGDFVAYMPLGSNGYSAFYDSNKEYISRFYVSQSGFTKIVTPPAAKYFIVSNTRAGLKTLQIYNPVRLFMNRKVTDIKGFFARGSIDANGKITRDSRNLVTLDMLYSNKPTTIYVKKNAPTNLLVDIYDPMGGAFVSESVAISQNDYYIVPANTPFRIIARDNSIGRMNFNTLAEYFEFDYAEPNIKTRTYYTGQTPITFPHENVTTSAVCNIIETSTGKIIVNDASHASNNAFIASLLNDGRGHFDYYIQSHWHDDHCGLLGEFIRLGRIDSNTVVFLPQNLHEDFLSVFPNEQGTWTLYNRYITALQNSGATLVYPTENSKYYIDGLILQFWNTEHDKYYTLEGEKNYNDLSLCFYLINGNCRVGFPGDLGPTGQEQCADEMLHCNIWQAEHHGWDNGVNNLKTAFIDKVSPEVVVANDGAAHDIYFEQDGSPMVTWCLNNAVPFYRCYKQQTGYVSVEVTPDSWQILDVAQRYRRQQS